MDPVVSVHNTNFSGNTKEFAKFLDPTRETKSHLHWQFIGIWQRLWRSFLESLHVNTAQIGNKWDCWESSAQSERSYVCSVVAIRTGWKMVGRFRGMKHLSAKHSRSLVWLEESIRKTFWILQESRIDDYWNTDGSRDFSDSWTGFTQFTLSSEKPPEGCMWSGGRSTRKQLTSRPDHLWPELWERMGKNAKLREKHKWAIEKPKLDNARRLQGIYFIDPEDMEYKEIIENARRKLETTMAPAMPCKTCKKNKHGETRSKTNLNLRVSWKPVNPQECVWKNLYQSIMRTISQEKVTIHDSITIWYKNLFLCLKQWRYPQQKQQWIKNRRNLKRFRRGTQQKSETNQRWSMKQGRRA